MGWTDQRGSESEPFGPETSTCLNSFGGKGTDLRCRGDVLARKPDVGCPSHIPHPVVVAFNNLLLDPLLCLFVESPYPDQVV